MSAEMMKTDSAAVQHPTDQMWREVLPQLRRFVRRRIADPDRADDVVADILLRIHQNVASRRSRAAAQLGFSHCAKRGDRRVPASRPQPGTADVVPA